MLGGGGMASVFLGRRADGQVAAVKVLHLSLSQIEELRKRFLREGPIGSALAAVGPLCEGLPLVLESGVADDGAAYLVMEVLEGETVFDRMARWGRSRWARCWRSPSGSSMCWSWRTRTASFTGTSSPRICISGAMGG